MMNGHACACTPRPGNDQVVALERDMSDTDGDGRLLRYVYTVRGEWVNGALVRGGYARVTIYRPDSRHAAARCGLAGAGQGGGCWRLG